MQPEDVTARFCVVEPPAEPMLHGKRAKEVAFRPMTLHEHIRRRERSLALAKRREGGRRFPSWHSQGRAGALPCESQPSPDCQRDGIGVGEKVKLDSSEATLRRAKCLPFWHRQDMAGALPCGNLHVARRRRNSMADS